MRIRGLLCVTAALFLLPAPPAARAQEEKPKEGDPALERGARSLQQQVTRLRGLEFKRDVRIGIKDDQELRVRILEMIDEEYSVDRMRAVQTAGIKLGLFPAGFELRKTLAALLSEQVAGFYDPHRKELYVIRKSQGGAAQAGERMVELLTGVKARDLYAVHELTHAAQDQHYDLETLPMEVKDNDDLVMAVKALVEGDATYVMFEYLARSLGLTTEQLAQGGLPTDVLPFEGAARQAPEFLKQSLVFPYFKGLEFVLRAKKQGGLERVGALYDDLPASTEQILHPSKYFGAERDAPTSLRWAPPAALPAAEWTLLESNVLGEFGVQVLLKVRGGTSGRAAASGWDGDRYEVYEKKAGDGLLLVWVSTWDTERDAGEFAEALGAALAVPGGGDSPAATGARREALEGPSPEWRGWRSGAESAWLKIAGKDVFAADGWGGAEAPVRLFEELQAGMKREEMAKVARVPRKERPGEAGGGPALHPRFTVGHVDKNGALIYRWRFNVPDGWKQRVPDVRVMEEDTPAWFEQAGSSAVIQVRVVERAGRAAGAVAAGIRGARAKSLHESTVTPREGVRVAGRAAASWTVMGWDDEARESCTIRDVIVEGERHAFVLTLGAPGDEFEAKARDFERALETFEIEDAP